MPFVINKIMISKTGENTGVASVKLVNEDGHSLTLNKFQIDLNSGDSPVSTLVHEGTSLFAGDVVDDLKDVIFEMFQTGLAGEKPGIFEIKKGQIKRIK